MRALPCVGSLNDGRRLTDTLAQTGVAPENRHGFDTAGGGQRLNLMVVVRKRSSSNGTNLA